MEAVKKLRFPPSVSLCLVCGVDSGTIRNFLFLFIGSLVLATVLLLVWALTTRRLGEDDKRGAIPLQAEERGDE